MNPNTSDAMAEPEPHPQTGPHGSVLVIDDEPGIREMLAYRLSQVGFEVETAESGSMAVQAAKCRKFDVAVTDLKMAGMDGVATLKALRALDPDIEVIVATGYANVETAVECMKNGAYDYIQKPFDVKELCILIERAMQKNHLRGVLALYEASQALLATLRHSEVLDMVLTLSRRVLQGDAATLVVARSDGRGAAVHRQDVGGGLTDEFFISVADRVGEEQRPLRAVLSSGSPTFAGAQCGPYDAVLAYPLAARGRTLGALVVLRHEGARPFAASELQKGTVLANQVALSLDNARLYGELEAKITELVATREHLLQVEKLALAGHLAQAVAHEVNNPLSVVLANLDDIREYAATVARMWSTADDRSRAGGERAERMVRDILEFADETLVGARRIADLVRGFNNLGRHRDSSPAEHFEVVEVIRECLTSWPLEHVPPVLAADHVSATTFSSREDLQTALLQLLEYVSRSASGRAAAQPVTVSLDLERGRPCILISDPTLRLSAEERRRVFDPKVEVEPSGRVMRLNLALALSCRLLHQNRAEISVECDPGGGSVFRILLPPAQSHELEYASAN